jgi:hypothetical protein
MREAVLTGIPGFTASSYTYSVTVMWIVEYFNILAICFPLFFSVAVTENCTSYEVQQYHNLRLLFVRGVITSLLVGGLGVDGNRMVSLYLLFVFVGSGQTGSVQITTKYTKWNGKGDSICFCCCFSSFLKNKCWFCVFQVAAMCEKFRGMSWNIILNGSVQAIEWCMNFSNTTFLFRDIAG